MKTNNIKNAAIILGIAWSSVSFAQGTQTGGGRGIVCFTTKNIASRILDAANSAGLGAVTGGLSTSVAGALSKAHEGAVKIDNARDKYADKLKDKRANAFANANNKIAQGLGKVEGKVMGEIKKVNEIGSAVKTQYNLEKNNLRKKTDAVNAESENFA